MTLDAVSYTHLDVYKRQILSRKSTESNSLINVKSYRDLINSMSDMEKEISQTNVNSHIQQHILVKSRAEVYSQKYPSSQINVLDALKLPKHNYIVYLIQVSKQNNGQDAFSEESKQKLYIGTLKDDNLGIISRESSVKIPEPFKNYSLGSARFVLKRVPNLLRETELANTSYNSSNITEYRGEDDDNEEDDGTITIPVYITENEENDDFVACTAKISVDGRSASLVFPKEKRIL